MGRARAPAQGFIVSYGFTKLFASITDSSIWAEDDQTRILWVTMLSMADQFGVVHAAVPGLANRARISIEATEAALNKFLQPDQYSRSKEHDGRRIEAVDGGWRLLNYVKFRELRGKDIRREQNRLAKQRERDRKKAPPCHPVSNSVSNCQQSQPRSAQAEAEADIPPTPLRVSNHVGTGSKRIYELKTKKEEIEKLMTTLRATHYAEVAGGGHWDDDAKRKQYFVLKKKAEEISRLIVGL